MAKDKKLLLNTMTLGTAMAIQPIEGVVSAKNTTSDIQDDLDTQKKLNQEQIDRDKAQSDDVRKRTSQGSRSLLFQGDATGVQSSTAAPSNTTLGGN